MRFQLAKGSYFATTEDTEDTEENLLVLDYMQSSSLPAIMKRLCLTQSHAEDGLSRQRLPFQATIISLTIMRSSSSAMLNWAVLKSGL